MGVAATYAGRVALTAWRRKPTVIGVAVLLVLAVVCLHYSSNAVPAAAVVAAAVNTEQPAPPRPRSLAAAPDSNLLGEGGSVHFVQNDLLGTDPAPMRKDVELITSRAVIREQPSREEMANRHIPGELYHHRGSTRQPYIDQQQALYQLGVPIVNLDPRRPYVPPHRLLHLDLKGAPPKSEKTLQRSIGTRPLEIHLLETWGHPDLIGPSGIEVLDESGELINIQRNELERSIPDIYGLMDGISFTTHTHPYASGQPKIGPCSSRVAYLKLLFPLARRLGATGVLVEWEDMFPWEGPLRPLAASNSYSMQEVLEIVESARASQLEVIPLVQTFGHVEFALKHSEFQALREVPDSAQALCPSLNASLDFVERVIDQVMKVHSNARYLHIGCDEVFQMGECPRCRAQMRDSLFLAHVSRVATMVRTRYPQVKPIIWDDMLRHLSPQSLEDSRIGDMVEPMVWVYAEDVYRFVPTMVWDKYAAVFSRVWAASAFKGAFGETLYIPNVKRHLENNLRWLEVMSAEASKFRGGFSGIALTGWQRYDHYSVLCELLPAAVPSLAVNLLATSHGYFNQSLRTLLHSNLGCARPPSSSQPDNIVNLNSDPFLWDKFGRCFFPGAPFFKLTYRLHAAELEVKELLESVRLKKGWMTDYNVRHNFSTPLRVDELMAEQPRVYHTLLALVRSSQDAMQDIFDGYTISEWVEQRIYPMIKDLERLQQDASALKAARNWPARPLPPLPDLRRLGLPLPGDTDTGHQPAK